MSAQLVALTGLSMALGWRIRGQFGHEMKQERVTLAVKQE